jgi:hypothetical protein
MAQPIDLNQLRRNLQQPPRDEREPVVRVGPDGKLRNADEPGVPVQAQVFA